MSRKKVLVVDDSPLILGAMFMKLTASGYDVVTAEDGGAAVSAVRHEKPAHVLPDIGFPADVAHGGGGSRGTGFSS
jgi:two-component system KDP operon response regulator KdpE